MANVSVTISGDQDDVLQVLKGVVASIEGRKESAPLTTPKEQAAPKEKAAKVKKVEEPKVEIEETEPEEENGEDEITDDMLLEATKPYIVTPENKVKVKAILTSFGAAGVTKVAQENRAEYLKKLSKIK